MKTMRKIISVVIVAVMMVCNIQVVSYAEGNLLLDEDFNSISSISSLPNNWDFYYYPKGTATKTQYTPELVSDSDGNAIKITQTPDYDQVRAVYSFSDTLGGAIRIKYSIKPGENVTTLVSLSNNSNWVTCFAPDHSLLFGWAGTDTVPYTVARNLTYNEWYDIEIYADLVGKKCKTWVSDRKGNSWESDYASIGSDTYNKLYFRCWGSNTGSSYIDNVELKQLPLGIGIENDKIGNIFDQTDNETFSVTIGNSSSEQLRGIMSWSVKNDYTSEEKKGNLAFDIQAKGKKDFNLTLDVKKFGTYTMTVHLQYYKNGILVEDNETRIVKFSKIFASNNGERNDNFGFSTINLTLEPVTPQQAFKLIEKAGANGIRNVIAWQTTETADRVLGFTDANNRIVEAIDESDMTNMITLGYGHKGIVSQTKLEKHGIPGLWEWTEEVEMEPSHHRAPWKDEDIAAFANYCQYVVQNTDAQYYEIWNEWDGPFNVDLLDQVAYVKVLKAAYNAIKEVKPDAMVLSNSFGDNESFQKALDAGMYEYCDGFVCHGYMAQSYFPSSFWLDKFQDRLQMIRDYENSNGYMTRKNMFFNENGISTAIDYVPNDNNWRTVTESEQAEIAVKYVAFLREYDLTEYINWFSLFDPGVDSTEKEDMWGVLYHPKNFEKTYLAKPAYASIAAMNKLMNGGITRTEWDKIEITEARDRRYNANGSNYGPLGMMDCYLGCAYAFERGANDGVGNNLAVIWSDEAEREYTLKLGCNTVDMYDLFGNKTSLSSADGVYNIKVDDTLVYLAGDFTIFEEASGSISIAEYDPEKNIMHISGFIKDDMLTDESTVPVEVYQNNQLVKEFTVKIVDGMFDKVFSLSNEGTYLIKVGTYAEKEVTIELKEVAEEKIISSIDSGISIYIDDEKNICIDGKVNNYAENENVSVIVVPKDRAVKQENILYIKQLEIEDDGSFSDKMMILDDVPSVDVYIGATNASAIKSDITRSIFKVTSLSVDDVDKITASATIYNSTTADENAIIIIAQYSSDDALVAISMKDVTAKKNITDAQVFSHTVEKKSTARKYKAFIWRSTTDLTPLFNSVSIGG